WFFLMAAEIYNVGARDFRLPGLGSYLQTAAAAGDTRALLLGLGTLVLIIVLLDQFVWRPLLAWADKFKVEMTEGEDRPTSWVLDVLSRSWLVRTLGERYWDPFAERVDNGFRRRAAGRPVVLEEEPAAQLSRVALAVLVVLALGAG